MEKNINEDKGQYLNKCYIMFARIPRVFQILNASSKAIILKTNLINKKRNLQFLIKKDFAYI